MKKNKEIQFFGVRGKIRWILFTIGLLLFVLLTDKTSFDTFEFGLIFFGVWLLFVYKLKIGVLKNDS